MDPLYSDTARALGVEGRVVLEAVVRKDGSVDAVRVKEGLGYGLDENAMLALRRLQLLPATRNGEPVDVAMDIAVEFRLSETPSQPSSQGFLVKPRCVTRLIAPTVISRAEPQYTANARSDRIQGTVVLEIVVRPDGHAEVLRVVRSLGYGLDAAAVDSIGQWGFRPGSCDGRPLDVTLKLEINFNLR
jgi:TonB family protein